MKKCSYCKQVIDQKEPHVSFKRPNHSGRFIGDYDNYHNRHRDDCFALAYRKEHAESERRTPWEKIYPAALAEIDRIQS